MTVVVDQEPTIAVGLIDNAESVRFRLLNEFVDASGTPFPAGDYTVTSRDGIMRGQGPKPFERQDLTLSSGDNEVGRFAINATIGIQFHWQQTESQRFGGALRLLPRPDNRLSVINDVLLESYILSVICSEMSAQSPGALAQAHSIMSRSWLLAQLQPKAHRDQVQSTLPANEPEVVRIYDREAHSHFDVCADDHCQRYQGTRRIQPGTPRDAVKQTRGQVLTHDGRICDARFSKCCGGVSEAFRVAWAETHVPYLVPVWDGQGRLPNPPLTDEHALRHYLQHPPKVYCNCQDDRVLSRVLNDYDRQTRDFFRWQVQLSAQEAGDVAAKKLGLALGRLCALEPVERGLSGRLTRLRLVGEQTSVVIGKELEIRRVLSPSHLYSSAFVIDVQGPTHRPEAFVLHGAGWGHGVGLCQIGAAVMAVNGAGYRNILQHYYPGTQIGQLYN